MSKNGLLEQRPAGGVSRATLIWLILSAAPVLAALWLYFDASNGTVTAMVTGDFLILAAALLAAASCGRAARRDGTNARAWALMSLALYVWAAGMAIWTFLGLVNNHAYPFPSPADIGFVGYSIPAAIALFSFKGPGETSSVGVARSVLDAAVISGSVLVISWHTALGPALSSEENFLPWLTTLAYPVVDVILTSLVLVLGMRRQPGERLPWLFFGGGLLVLTVTDSTYVQLTFDGVTGITGSPLALGWICAFLLIALAPLVPYAEKQQPDKKVYLLGLELLPYAPILVALVMLAAPHVSEMDVFLLAVARITVFLILVRQVLILVQNITLTKGLEQEVAARTTELEGLGAIVNSSTDAILSTTSEGIVTSWNPGAQLQYGYTAEEAIGRDGRFLLPPGVSDGDDEMLEQLRGGAALNYEREHRRKDGTLIPVSLTVSPIRKNASFSGIAVISRDITQRRAAEDELKAARAAALEASRLKSEFLATMSHEIRTPMNGVVGLSALLLETPLNETQGQYTAGIKDAGDALLTLINDILDFSKLEAGKVELDLRPFDPRLLVDEVAGLLAGPARAKRLELMAYCEPEVPARLVGDSGRIRQVLLNLASNAVKFTVDGEVAIRVTTETPDPGPGSKGMVCFEVRDTGIGIEASHHERLFESFSQADASTTRRYGGTGLGLAICSRLTEAMDGAIGLTSVPGEGSTFWFRIPLPVGPPATEPVPTAGLTGLRVLVVDDNATNRLVLESQLRGWRLQPETVPDAQAALTRAREAAERGEPFDLAVLDLCMPGTDGLELARAIKADAVLADIELIMLTSTMQTNAPEIEEAGVREWLMKPVRSSEFYNRLLRLTSTKDQHGPSAPHTTSLPMSGQNEPEAAARGRILVAEDNEVNQLVARATLTKFGYGVDIVADGAEAVAATAGPLYDAVLMDCHMPVMDGFEATRIIRSRAGGSSKLPIIAMTAGALDGDRERCIAAGMDDYLSKPVDAAELGAALNRWVPAWKRQTRDSQQPASSGGPSIDSDRLATLRDLGPADGLGLLPEAAQAFRNDAPARLAAIRDALNSSGGPALEQAAHALKGAAANIGATAVAALCAELEQMGRSGSQKGGAPLVGRVEAELVQVNLELDNALGPAQ